MINESGSELDAFEERLLAELKTVAGAQAATTDFVTVEQPRTRLWYLPVAGAVAAVTIALVAVFPRPAPAYAVSGGNGEDVTVKVTRLEGAQALQDALLERGIVADITYLPSNEACRAGRYSEVDATGLSLTVGSDLFEVRIPAGAVGEGNTFVLSAAVTPVAQGVQAVVDYGIARGRVAPCTVGDAS